MKIKYRLFRLIHVGFRLCKKSVISIINSITYKIYKYLINLASMMVKMSSVSESILVSKVRIVGLCIAGR